MQAGRARVAAKDDATGRCSEARPRTVYAMSIAWALAGCGAGASATQPAGPSDVVASVSPTEAAPTTTRVFCKEDAVWTSLVGGRLFGAPPRNAELRVEVPASASATRARVTFATSAGDVYGYAAVEALGLFVQVPTQLQGAPVHMVGGARVCVPLHGGTPDSLPCEATVQLAGDWTFELMPPARRESSAMTWRGSVARDAVGTSAERTGRTYSGHFNGTALELLTSDGRVLARGPAPRTGVVILGREGELLEVVLTDTFGMTGLHGFLRSPYEPPPPPTEHLGSLSGSFGIGGTGLDTNALPREARPLAELATDRPLHALVPGATLTLPTGQRLSLPAPTYARVLADVGRVAVVFADGTILTGSVDPAAIGDRVVEAEGR